MCDTCKCNIRDKEEHLLLVGRNQEKGNFLIVKEISRALGDALYKRLDLALHDFNALQISFFFYKCKISSQSK